MKNKHSLGYGAAFEIALLVLAFGWGSLFHFPVVGDLRINIRSTLVGAGASLPLFLFFVWCLRSKIGFLVQHRRMMDRRLRPVFQDWSILQLAIISLLAGVCEEALFRGALQGSLAERIGYAPAVLLASLAFGACHLITWTYAAFVVIFGIYFGVLWIWTGNLLAPMITHALYDFLALAYFLKLQKPDACDDTLPPAPAD